MNYIYRIYNNNYEPNIVIILHIPSNTNIQFQANTKGLDKLNANIIYLHLFYNDKTTLTTICEFITKYTEIIDNFHVIIIIILNHIL